VILDAKALEIFSVKKINQKGEKLIELTFSQKEKFKLRIELDKTYQKNEEIILEILYKAQPNKLTDYEEGYFEENKGVYFINPLKIFPEKPQQIWTQGETSAASAWFPTFDAPNVKTTQELLITVDSKFQTLSNGKLIQTKINKDGTRTDFWKQNVPHAPYLFMFVVGEFALFREENTKIPIDYLTEKAFAPHAKAVFGNTPDMMKFFSELLDCQYPWEKYAQVVVRDFISGAMENTSASVFMEGVQVDSISAKDTHWDDIIAHELFHHWFGNYVTAESWANLALNEAFANYSEYLWREHRYGKFSADAHRKEERDNYFFEAKSKKEPLIRFHYASEEDMFDNHSYAKGGLILHFLRKTAGEEAFFAALRLYLKKHAFGKAEAHQFRICLEEITGQDWNGFFNQWFFSAGHPEIHLKTDYFNNTLKIFAAQKQAFAAENPFEIPMSVTYQIGEKTFSQNILLQNQTDTFTFLTESEPDFIVFDREKIIPGEIFYSQKLSSVLKQIRRAENFFEHQNGLDSAILHFYEPEVREFFRKMLLHKEAEVRLITLDLLGDEELSLPEDFKADFQNIFRKDENSLCRTLALQNLARKYTDTQAELSAALNDSSYFVRSNALYLLHLLDDENIEKTVARYEFSDDRYLLYTVMEIYARRGTAGKMNWFLKKIQKKSASELVQLLNPFTNYLLTLDEKEALSGKDYLVKLARHDDNPEVRKYAFQMLVIMAGNPENSENTDILKDVREEIYQKERDFRVRKFMEELR
jgi:aminopeptidase N